MARTSSSGYQKMTTNQLTNKDVINALQKLSGDRPFGSLQEGETPEFLRQLYEPLRSLFSTTTSTSQANRVRVEKIDKLTIPHWLENRFSSFQKDPLEFWERLVKEIPQYSRQEQKARSRTFFQGAAQLDSNIEEQRILQRFVAISAYNLFRREFPTSAHDRVLEKQLEVFLDRAELPVSEDRSTCKKIVQRGQRLTQFCQCLSEGKTSFGSLFFPSIPDTIWEDGGLRGQDFEGAINHLKNKSIGELSRRTNANSMAETLLGFHFDFVWTPRSALRPSKKTGKKLRAGTKRRRADEQSSIAIDSLSRENSRSMVDTDDGPQVLTSSTDAITNQPRLSANESRVISHAPGVRTAQQCSPFPWNSTYPAIFTERPSDTETFPGIPEPELDMTHLDFFNPDLKVAYLNFYGPTKGSTDLDSI